MKTKKLLYIYPQKSTFINNDIDFLNKNYKVITQDLQWNKAQLLPLNLVKQLFFLLFNIRNTQAIIVSFGGYFSLLPTFIGKLFNVKTFIILNGTECVSFPNFNYGSLRKPTLKRFIKTSFKNATKLLPVDASLLYQNYTFDESTLHKSQGVFYHFEDINVDVTIIPNGFKTSNFTFNINQPKKGFLTVANVTSLHNITLKGIDLFIQTAKQFPNETFTIIGVSKTIKTTFTNVPNNVIFKSFLPMKDLIKEYQNHAFYVQVSLNEGFGCALAEAMLSGCVPIISNVGALPNVTNNIGFVLQKRDISLLINIVKDALQLSENERKVLSEKAHKRILENYDISKREQLILQEIKS